MFSKKGNLGTGLGRYSAQGFDTRGLVTLGELLATWPRRPVHSVCTVVTTASAAGVVWLQPAIGWLRCHGSSGASTRKGVGSVLGKTRGSGAHQGTLPTMRWWRNRRQQAAGLLWWSVVKEARSDGFMTR
jgi:hypothetical protein